MPGEWHDERGRTWEDLEWVERDIINSIADNGDRGNNIFFDNMTLAHIDVFTDHMTSQEVKQDSYQWLEENLYRRYGIEWTDAVDWDDYVLWYSE